MSPLGRKEKNSINSIMYPKTLCGQKIRDTHGKKPMAVVKHPGKLQSILKTQARDGENRTRKTTPGDDSPPVRHIFFLRRREGMTRFIDNRDGTITDTKTGLIWLKDANYLGGQKSYQEAAQACRDLGEGWRLPERLELESLLDLIQCEPALSQGHPFINVQSSYYWSATTYAGNTSYAWIVSMSYGYVHDDFKANGDYVWPVRGGQSDIQ